MGECSRKNASVFLTINLINMEYDFGQFFILNFKSGNRVIINKNEVTSIFEQNDKNGTSTVEIELKNGSKYHYESNIDEMMKDIEPFIFEKVL